MRACCTSPARLLGMRRLSIIDLSGGHQPVFNEDGSVGVVFNGEIYNFAELREQLEKCGHRFRTRSDTEVIVHAYEEWGEQCVSHLRGMFAFAIWDGQAGIADARVLLARDRLGIKPLYYAIVDGSLLFSFRSSLAAGQRRRRAASGSRIDRSVSALWLRRRADDHGAGRLLAPAGPLHDGVLPRSTQMQTGGVLGPRPRPSPRFARMNLPKTIPEAAQAVRPLLEQAVRSHLIADVPLGLFLSGGLDSTALIAMASRERQGLHTFTIVFPEQEFSEAEIARRTAERFGAEHRELMVSGEDMVARLPQAVGALDQPSMDGVNTYFVSYAARSAGLKVALSGLGGDEVFGGYPTFRMTPRVAAAAAVARKLPAALRRAMTRSLLGLGREGRSSSRTDALRKFGAVWNGPDSLPHPYFFTRLLFTAQQIQNLGLECARPRQLRSGARRCSRLPQAARRTRRRCRRFVARDELLHG